MRSLVNWALLGIVIERPSYAYELARRFERTYGDALSLSSISHVYTALGTLRERALVEEVAGTRDARQPKPHYRATDMGVQAYGEWLVGQIGEERQRQRLFALSLSTLTQHHEIALEILDRYEVACLEQARDHPLATGEEEDAREDGRDAQLGARLAGEDTHLTAEAKLAWIDYARREIERRAGRAARGA